jgi:hypothetical protein
MALYATSTTTQMHEEAVESGMHCTIAEADNNLHISDVLRNHGSLLYLLSFFDMIDHIVMCQSSATLRDLVRSAATLQNIPMSSLRTKSVTAMIAAWPNSSKLNLGCTLVELTRGASHEAGRAAFVPSLLQGTVYLYAGTLCSIGFDTVYPSSLLGC